MSPRATKVKTEWKISLFVSKAMNLIRMKELIESSKVTSRPILTYVLKYILEFVYLRHRLHLVLHEQRASKVKLKIGYSRRTMIMMKTICKLLIESDDWKP